MFSLICKEEDAESKHVYFFLFKLLRKSILTASPGNVATQPPISLLQNELSSSTASANSNPTSLEAHLGKPPFEEISITKV